MVQWRTHVNMLLYSWVTYDPRDFLTSRAIRRLSLRTLIRDFSNTVHLFICGLFNGELSSSDYTASSGRRTSE